MRYHKHLAIAAMTSALAIGMLAAPAAAQLDPRVAFVNGIPGRVVDVCIGNNEVRSNLRYGRWFQRVVNPGNPTIRFRVARPGNCTGNVLAQAKLNGLNADDDLTLVATRIPAKVVVFFNTPVPVGNVNVWYVRHAADVGDAAISFEFEGLLQPNALPPTSTWEKGDESIVNLGTESFTARFTAARADGLEAIAESRAFLTFPERRHEFILIGTNANNARFVGIARPTL